MDKLLQSKYNSLEKKKNRNDYIHKFNEELLNRTESIRLTKRNERTAL